MKNHQIVWDIPTRILHWLIAIPVILNIFLDGGGTTHKVVGYVSIGALILRHLWGFTPQGRIIKRPPLQAWIYALIWITVALLGVTGYMMGLDAFWGEDWVEETHEIIFQILMALVLLHLLGIALDAYKFKSPTWLGMITGKK